jgi:hypothetical protein
MRGGGHLGHPGEQKLRPSRDSTPNKLRWYCRGSKPISEAYRLRVERDGSNALLITRDGYDWTKRFP